MNWVSILEGIAAGAAYFTLPGSIELTQLTAGALLPLRKPRAMEAKPVRLAVVIPAHNEEECIARCLQSLRACDPAMDPRDIYVVADNCNDKTAEIARVNNVSVLERHNLTHRGKGYALEFAFGYLRRAYDAFVIVDADSVVPQGFLESFRKSFAKGAQALQCYYLVGNPDETTTTRLMDLSLRAFNMVRPRGRARWNQSVGILGNGFGLTRKTLEKVPYTAKSVVEDLEYHIELLRTGIKVELLAETHVYGLMPVSTKARSTQRARWEGGRLRMIREFAPRLMGEVFSGRTECIEPLLDLLLLPLSFHVLLLTFAAIAGHGMMRWIGVGGLAIVLLHLIAAIAAGNSVMRDLRAIASVPGYVLWKILRLPMIVATSARGSAWVRTERTTREAA